MQSDHKYSVTMSEKRVIQRRSQRRDQVTYTVHYKHIFTSEVHLWCASYALGLLCIRGDTCTNCQWIPPVAELSEYCNNVFALLLNTKFSLSVFKIRYGRMLKKCFKTKFLKVWGYLYFLNAFLARELLHSVTEHTGLQCIIIMEKLPSFSGYVL